jgi:hypothetical protein
VLLSPWLAVAVISGLIAQYVSARSLQTGDAVSVTALTGVAVNVANIAGGILIFGDPLAHGPAGTLTEAGAFVAICVGAFLTPTPSVTEARSGNTPEAPPKSPQPDSGEMRPKAATPMIAARSNVIGVPIDGTHRRALGTRTLS